MIRQFTAIAIAVLALLATSAKEKTFTVSSPSGAVKAEVTVANGKITYDVSRDGDVVLTKSEAALEIDGKKLGATVRRTNKRQVRESFKPAVPLKFSTVDNNYNLLVVWFKEKYSLEVRAYDDGVAYRFVTALGGEINLTDETVLVNFPEDCLAHLQPVRGWKDSSEREYVHTKCSEQTVESPMCVLPALFEVKGHLVFMSETNVFDYSHMVLQGTSSKALKAKFPRTPLEERENGDRSRKILKEANYFTRTQGSRQMPWRYFVVANSEAELLTTTMAVRLPGPAVIDASWVKPGQVSWDWWNGLGVYGPDVDFVSGINTATYKYHVDFASKYGVRYIILDEGWSASTRDVMHPCKDLDLEELVRYGNSKGVGVILWLTWTSVENNFDRIFKHYADMGVKGFKIDFMDRWDQVMVNYYERVIKEAAKYHLLVDFHGAYKPSGLEQLYPNLISYEGVRGMEYNGDCHPYNSVYLPFLRNIVGPMDYTPGSMQSIQPEYYGSRRPHSMSPGTRAYQLGLFVIFESGLQMLGDSPTQYYLNPEATEFITGVPTTWDETVPLSSKLGEYVVVAKRKGNGWWIGGMTGSKGHDVTVDLTKILDPSKEYKVTTFVDGPNADRLALDCRRTVSTLKPSAEYKIHMARNGGFAAVIEEK